MHSVADAYAARNFDEGLTQRRQALKYSQDISTLLDTYLFVPRQKEK